MESTVVADPIKEVEQKLTTTLASANSISQTLSQDNDKLRVISSRLDAIESELQTVSAALRRQSRCVLL